MKKLMVVAVLFVLALPVAAQSAACSPLNCAPSQFTLSGGTLIGYRASIGAPVTVADLRTGESLFSLPPGFGYGSVLVHQAGGGRVFRHERRTSRGRDGVGGLP